MKTAMGGKAEGDKLRRIKYTFDRRTGKYAIIAAFAIVAIVFLLISDSLIKELASQERERMDLWARATERLAKADTDSDFDLLLGIISANNNIPVLITDNDLNITEFRNFTLPDKKDRNQLDYRQLSQKNKDYLESRVRKAAAGRPLHELARDNRHFIEIELSHGMNQYIYFEDSHLLRSLSLYPYIQMVVMLLLALIIYLAMVYTKRAEQNRVWVGLSKETAHQLGTPISSLMAWSEYLGAIGVEREVTSEIDKDVKRLSVIADRFSKIGSRPEMQLEYLNDIIGKSLDYMQTRISGKVKIAMHLSADDHGVMLSRPLVEWVMENLTKNAVDAMQGEGRIDVTTGSDRGVIWVEVKDTGKGIARKNFKTVFNPGYTTKKRGWGLGLTLVKRIIEDYHGGRIFVKSSEIGIGTVFRIEFPEAR